MAPAAKADAESSESSDSDAEGEEKEDKYADGMNMQAKFDAKNRVSVRNLRIREDTAKYLRNLDVNSAHYDPKTRTMRSNPYSGTGNADAAANFAGDNFVRYDKTTQDIGERQLFAWESTSRGEEIHAQADPTIAEIRHRQHQEQKDNFKETTSKSILDKYGGQEHLQAPPKELLMAQTEHYVEYSRGGRIIKGEEAVEVVSKFDEDIHPGNHKSVYGSFWRDGKWGFACCHSYIKESYCTGEQGKLASAMSDPNRLMQLKQAEAEEKKEPEAPVKSLADEHKEKMEKERKDAKDKKKAKKKRRSKNDSGSDSESDKEDEETKRKKKIQKVEYFKITSFFVLCIRGTHTRTHMLIHAQHTVHMHMHMHARTHRVRACMCVCVT